MSKQSYNDEAEPATGGNAAAVLRELAERAASAHGRSIEAWLETASILLEARELSNHGQWATFLEDSGLGERTARRMLQFARAGIKTVTVTVLGGVRETAARLAEVEAWPPAMRRCFQDDDNLMLAHAMHIETAMAIWELAKRLSEADVEVVKGQRDHIIQLRPDGPVKGAFWSRLGEALADAATPEETRAVWLGPS